MYFQMHIWNSQEDPIKHMKKKKINVCNPRLGELKEKKIKSQKQLSGKNSH